MVAEPNPGTAEAIPHTAWCHLSRRLPQDAVTEGVGVVHLLAPTERKPQPGSEVHSNGVGAVDRHVEAEPTALANVEVGHHLRIAPDRPAGLQRERLVDGQVVDEGHRRLQGAEPGGVRSHRVDHHVGAVFVVLAEVAVDVVHQHQHDHGPPGSVPADPQAAVVDHPLGGFGVHREHGHVLIRLADQHRHGEHGAGDGVLRSSHHDNLERVLTAPQANLRAATRPA